VTRKSDSTGRGNGPSAVCALVYCIVKTRNPITTKLESRVHHIIKKSKNLNEGRFIIIPLTQSPHHPPKASGHPPPPFLSTETLLMFGVAWLLMWSYSKSSRSYSNPSLPPLPVRGVLTLHRVTESVCSAHFSGASSVARIAVDINRVQVDDTQGAKGGRLV